MITVKKIVKSVLTVVLIAALILQTATCAFAASKKTEYVGEVILSYGKTPEDAKKWLTDKGYSYVDQNLNDGADDALSKERAVYMGYKTTTDPEKAITDMKLMNMNGGYSIQDYQMVLEEKKSDIQQFINQFIAVLNEYRTNYKNGSPRATAAYEMLNVIKDDDTGMLMGDLLLNKIKEEYSEKDFAALSATEKKQHADMTTILMQGNAQVVLCMEEMLATATDTNDELWLERITEADDYDTMLEEVMDEENVDPTKAQSILAARYDDDAKIIGGMAEGYREWLSAYTDSGVDLFDTDDKATAYINGLSEEDQILWCTKGSQYKLLDSIEYDDENSLLDLFTDEELDITGEDVTLLYPIVSVLSDGQRAVLDFVCGYQFFAMGLNTDEVTTDSNLADLVADEDGTVSVFAGVDRSMYSDDVALTGEAYKLQSSTDKNYASNWFDQGISTLTKVLGIMSIASITITIGAFVSSALFSSKSTAITQSSGKIFKKWSAEFQHLRKWESAPKGYIEEMNAAEGLSKSYSYWSGIFFTVGVALTVVSIILSGATLWFAYQDLKEYYHTDFTPIPMWMVDQGVNDKDEKVFTYYKAVTCNRVDGKFTSDNTKLMKNFGDINGDVGRQWLALYTTTDKNAGDPIVAEFKTQVGSSKIPGDFTALSIFCNKVAQNLTDKKSGFTYSDDLGGIYLFYNTDTTVFAGSAITTGTWAAIAGGAVLIAAIASLLIIRKKKNNKAEAAE